MTSDHIPISWHGDYDAPDYKEEEAELTELASRAVAVYCDGGVVGKNPSDLGGTYAWCWVDKGGNRVLESSGVCHFGEPVTNNVSELVAMLDCLQNLPSGWSGKVYSDSLITIGRVFYGWKANGVPKCLLDGLERGTERLGKLTPILLDGHPTKKELAANRGHRGHPVSIHNVWCDKECNRLADHVKRCKDQATGRSRL